MKYKLISFVLMLFLPFAIQAGAPEEIRQKCAEQMQKAFELQSKGKTRLAFYMFRDAYQLACKVGNLLLY